MLSRVADSLYWMSRYVERAENIARILDVNLQLRLDLPAMNDEKMSDLWLAVLRSTGDEQDFLEQYDKVTTDSVIDFLTLNTKNHNSIMYCLTNARENARHVREQISEEMWEEINRTYLQLKGTGTKSMLQRNLYQFFEQVKISSHLFQGITDSTMLHGEGWDFIQVGKFLERADKTTRILDANEDILLPRPTEANEVPNPGTQSATEAVQFNAILRSCSAQAAYRRTYTPQVRGDRIVEFLVLDEAFPRSIRYCAGELDCALRRVSGAKEENFTNLAEKFSGRFVAELNFSGFDDIMSRGLHDYIDDQQKKLNDIGQAVFETYMYYAAFDPEAEESAAEQTQAPGTMTQSLGGMTQTLK